MFREYTGGIQPIQGISEAGARIGQMTGQGFASMGASLAKGLEAYQKNAALSQSVEEDFGQIGLELLKQKSLLESANEPAFEPLIRRIDEFQKTGETFHTKSLSQRQSLLGQASLLLKSNTSDIQMAIAMQQIRYNNAFNRAVDDYYSGNVPATEEAVPEPEATQEAEAPSPLAAPPGGFGNFGGTSSIPADGVVRPAPRGGFGGFGTVSSIPGDGVIRPAPPGGFGGFNPANEAANAEEIPLWALEPATDDSPLAAPKGGFGGFGGDNPTDDTVRPAPEGGFGGMNMVDPVISRSREFRREEVRGQLAKGTSRPSGTESMATAADFSLPEGSVPEFATPKAGETVLDFAKRVGIRWQDPKAMSAFYKANTGRGLKQERVSFGDAFLSTLNPFDDDEAARTYEMQQGAYPFERGTQNPKAKFAPWVYQNGLNIPKESTKEVTNNPRWNAYPEETPDFAKFNLSPINVGEEEDSAAWPAAPGSTGPVDAGVVPEPVGVMGGNVAGEDLQAYGGRGGLVPTQQLTDPRSPRELAAAGELGTYLATSLAQAEMGAAGSQGPAGAPGPVGTEEERADYGAMRDRTNLVLAQRNAQVTESRPGWEAVRRYAATAEAVTPEQRKATGLPDPKALSNKAKMAAGIRVYDGKGGYTTTAPYTPRNQQMLGHEADAYEADRLATDPSAPGVLELNSDLSRFYEAQTVTRAALESGLDLDKELTDEQISEILGRLRVAAETGTLDESMWGEFILTAAGQGALATALLAPGKVVEWTKGGKASIDEFRKLRTNFGLAQIKAAKKAEQVAEKVATATRAKFVGSNLPQAKIDEAVAAAAAKAKNAELARISYERYRAMPAAAQQAFAKKYPSLQKMYDSKLYRAGKLPATWGRALAGTKVFAWMGKAAKTVTRMTRVASAAKLISNLTVEPVLGATSALIQEGTKGAYNPDGTPMTAGDVYKESFEMNMQENKEILGWLADTVVEGISLGQVDTDTFNEGGLDARKAKFRMLVNDVMAKRGVRNELMNQLATEVTKANEKTASMASMASTQRAQEQAAEATQVALQTRDSLKEAMWSRVRGQMPRGEFEKLYSARFPSSGEPEIRQAGGYMLLRNEKGGWDSIGKVPEAPSLQDVRKQRVGIYGEQLKGGGWKPELYGESGSISVAGLFSGPDSDIRTFNSGVNSAARGLESLDTLESLLETHGRSMSPEKRNTGELARTQIIGALRLPFLGPGQMTEQERAEIRNVVNNPANFFTLDNTSKRQIQLLRRYIANGIVDEGKLWGLDVKVRGSKSETRTNHAQFLLMFGGQQQ